MNTHLSLKWTTSRGHETYGYNVVTLTDQRTGKRYRAMGGGYDMVGTVFGDWLQDAHHATLRPWADKQGTESDGRTIRGFYGAFWVGGPQGVRLDGACGIDSMISVARALGIKLERTYKHTGPGRGETTGWLISTEGDA